MTESALDIEWYISKIRETLKGATIREEFFGNVSFEFNIKQGDITNMNVVKRESFKK